MKRILALALAIAMVFALAACGGGGTTNPETSDASNTSMSQEGSQSAAPASPGAASANPSANASTQPEMAMPELAANQAEKEYDEIVVGIESDGGTLAPWSSVAWGATQIFAMFFERLLFLAPDGTVQNCLMESYEQIDELTYHIKLFDYIYDSAGNNITAADAVFSIWDGFVGIGLNSGGVSNLESVRVIDEYTFEWKNSVPFGSGMLERQFFNPTIVSRAAYEASPDGFATNPVGTGAYKVAEYIPGNSITVEKRDDYWQTNPELVACSGIANVNRIVYNIILDSSQRAMALQSGNIDFAGALSVADLQFFADNPDFNIVARPRNSAWQLLLNATEQSPCQDINLRRAILNAVDPNSVAAACEEIAVPLTSIANPRMTEYNPAWNNRTVWSYDPEAAKADLALSSYQSGTQLRILIQSGSSTYEACAMVVQAQLEDIGISSVIEVVDSATYRVASAAADAYDILIMDNSGGYLATSAWNNSFGYVNGKTPINDPVLQQKLDQVILTGSYEDQDAFQGYVDEMAYGKGLVAITFQTAANAKKIENIFVGQDYNYFINNSTFVFP